MKEKVIGFIKKDTVLCVATTLAMVSAFFVKPTLNYVNYIDFRVLGILLSLMTVMAGLQRNGLFDMIGSSLLKRTKNTINRSNKKRKESSKKSAKENARKAPIIKKRA